MVSERLNSLSLQAQFTLTWIEPFDFRHTFWKPSHFFTGLELHAEKTSYRTFRIGTSVCGVRFEIVGQAISANVYADRLLSEIEIELLRRRIIYCYGLQEDLNEFLTLCNRTEVMRAPLSELRGMRQSCPESLFEIAIISLILQNATVHRTRQMMGNLLSNHGHLVRFDEVELRAFFTPQEIVEVTEDFHKEVNRLGYRAKYVSRFAEFFLDKVDLLSADSETLANFGKIKGVGPYTTAILASHATRDPSALGLDVWNRRILARYLLDGEDSDPNAVMAACTRTFPGYEGLGALYLLEFEYLANPVVPLES